MKYVEELYSQQPPKNPGGSWKCAFLSHALCICVRANPNSMQAELSTALSRASSSQFRHSTSQLLVVISLEVRTVEFSPSVLLTTTDSTGSRRKCCPVEALACSDVLELYYTSNSYGSRRASGGHPVRARPATGSCRTGDRTSRICWTTLYG